MSMIEHEIPLKPVGAAAGVNKLAFAVHLEAVDPRPARREPPHAIIGNLPRMPRVADIEKGQAGRTVTASAVPLDVDGQDIAAEPRLVGVGPGAHRYPRQDAGAGGIGDVEESGRIRRSHMPHDREVSLHVHHPPAFKVEVAYELHIPGGDGR